MKDLIERLRSTQNPGLAVRQQAADALERLTAENAALRDDHERACGLVAEMHAAAVGEVRGPTLGVVEDIAALRSRLAEAERDMDQLIGERDHAQGMADKLADAIATLLGVEIGEHSNMNCPWTQALEAFEERAASTVTQDAAP